MIYFLLAPYSLPHCALVRYILISNAHNTSPLGPSPARFRAHRMMVGGGGGIRKPARGVGSVEFIEDELGGLL